MSSMIIDGTPCDGKLSCTVWRKGKSYDNIKGLPIPMCSDTLLYNLKLGTPEIKVKTAAKREFC